MNLFLMGSNGKEFRHEKMTLVVALEDANGDLLGRKSNVWSSVWILLFLGTRKKMQNVDNRQSLAGKYTTGNYLANSAVSYNGKTLVVSAEKIILLK